MNKTRMMVFGLALGSAGLAAYLAQGFLKPQKEVVEINKVQTEDVLVAARDIAMGDRVDIASLTWKSWPKENVSPAMIIKATKPDAAEKLKEGRARNPIYQGEPINERKIVLPGDKGFMAAILPKGRAFRDRVFAGSVLCSSQRWRSQTAAIFESALTTKPSDTSKFNLRAAFGSYYGA